MEYTNNNDDWRQTCESKEKSTLTTTSTQGEENSDSPCHILKAFVLELQMEPEDTGFSKLKAEIMTSKLGDVKSLLSALQRKGCARFRTSPNDEELGGKIEDIPLDLCLSIVDTNYPTPSVIESVNPVFRTPHPIARVNVETVSSICTELNQHPSSAFSYQDLSSKQFDLNQLAEGCGDAPADQLCSHGVTVTSQLSLFPMSSYSSAGCSNAPARPSSTGACLSLQLDISHMHRCSCRGNSDAPTPTQTSTEDQVVPLKPVHEFFPLSDQTFNVVQSSTVPSQPQDCGKVQFPPGRRIFSSMRERQRQRIEGHREKVTVAQHAYRRNRRRIHRTGLNTIVVPAISDKLADIPADAFSWRKYGQKPIKDSNYPRSYYRCSINRECPARKHVERSSRDPTKLLVSYAGEHKYCV